MVKTRIREPFSHYVLCAVCTAECEVTQGIKENPICLSGNIPHVRMSFVETGSFDMVKGTSSWCHLCFKEKISDGFMIIWGSVLLCIYVILIWFFLMYEYYILRIVP